MSTVVCTDCKRDDAIVDDWEIEGNKFCVRCGIIVESKELRIDTK